MNILKKIYPLFFALFPLLFYYNANRFETTISSLFLPLTITFILYILLYGFIHVVIKDKMKFSIILSVFFFYFFSFVHFSRFFSMVKGVLNKYHLPADSLIVILYTVLFILLLTVLLQKKYIKRSTGILIIIGTYLIISPLFSIIPWEMERARPTADNMSIQIDGKSIIAKNEKPDIYYIILDRYANTKILSDFYNFDNSAFTEYLTKKGFYIADNSFANFPKTHLSNHPLLDFIFFLLL